MDKQPAIKIQNLKKYYNDVKAVDDLSVEIFPGEVFGLLGPNGAGKTTTVEILEGLRKADQGDVSVIGFSIPDELENIKQKVGVQLQTTDLPELIKVKELLIQFESYYEQSIGVDYILKLIGLEEKGKTYTKHLSGGQKQRLALALALINNPELLILDEPTTGLDPQARRNIWEIVKDLKKSGKTILLTTHYMEEAEQLCDRVGIIDYGKIIALGSPSELIEKQNLASAIELVLKDGFPLNKEQFREIEEIYQEGQKVTIFSRQSQKLLIKLVRALDNGELPIQKISLRRASLEDVFLDLTGRKLRE